MAPVLTRWFWTKRIVAVLLLRWRAACFQWNALRPADEVCAALFGVCSHLLTHPPPRFEVGPARVPRLEQQPVGVVDDGRRVVGQRFQLLHRHGHLRRKRLCQ